MSQTIIVSNRLPVSIKKSEKGLEVYPSSGGLATGLSSYANKKGNLWIGWPGIVSDELTEDDKKEITVKLAAYNCQPVFLSQKQIDDFYNGYSNSILWPFLHTMEFTLDHEARYWKAYREVNDRFCEAVLTLSDPGSVIWVHDYQLMLLPRLLREQRPHDNIGFFLHIPFPEASHFATLEHASTLIRGLLGADLIGFHTKSYAEKFLDSAQLLTSAAPIKDGLALKERAVRVTDFPMGIDYLKFSNATQERDVLRELKKLQKQYKDQKIILTVDRLDPTKGFIERLEAFQTLLAKNPDLHENIRMVMLAVPSRGEIDAYRDLKEQTEALIKKINKTYRTDTWKPIDFMYKSVSFEYLNALYQVADIAFVAPIRDGMNLVAKEYIASQGENKGILILSETAGAAQELREALLVSHDEPQSLVRALKKAIKMPPKELKRRVGALQKTIANNTVHDWAGSYMKSLSQPIAKQTPLLNELRMMNLLRNYEAAQHRMLLLDYDGVLQPFTDNPIDAAPSAELIELITSAAKRRKNHFVIISGRSQHDLETWLGHLPVTLIAEHGAMMRPKGQSWIQAVHTDDSWKAILKPALQKHANKAPGAFVEEKACSLVWHYRAASPYAAQKQIPILRSALSPFLRRYGLKLFMGNKIIEIKDPRINKGKAVKAIMDKPYDFIMAIGDDFTDEDMFRALPKRAISIKVGPGKTSARYRVKNVSQVQNLLKNL